MARPQYTPEMRILKFWSKVLVTKNDDDCWEWTGCKDRDGYGDVRPDPHSQTRAHRFAWMITNGGIPDGLFVCHKCDNRACCNPNHLFLGTTQDNTKDRQIKKRHAKGEKQGAHKLTNEQVDFIRERYALGGISQKDLGALFNVSQTTVYSITRYRSWRWRS